MKNKKTLCLIIIISIFFVFQLPALDGSLPGHDGYGIVKADDYGKLLNKTVRISSAAEKLTDSDTVELQSDYHMLTAVPLSVLRDKLIDLDAASSIFSRMTESVDLTRGKSLHYPHRQEVHTSYKFLGMGPMYSYRVHVFFDEISDTEFAMRWQLYDSMGCGIKDLAGSWYLRSMELDGEEFTYVRSYAESTIESPPLGLVLFTNIFGEFEISNTFTELIKSR